MYTFSVGNTGTGKTMMTSRWIHSQTMSNNQLLTHKIECAPEPNTDAAFTNIFDGLQALCNKASLRVDPPADLDQRREMKRLAGYMIGVFQEFVSASGSRDDKWLILLDDLELKQAVYTTFLKQLCELSPSLRRSNSRIIVTSHNEPRKVGRNVKPLTFETKPVLTIEEADEFLTALASEHYYKPLLPQIYKSVTGLPLALAIFAGELVSNEVCTTCLLHQFYYYSKVQALF